MDGVRFFEDKTFFYLDYEGQQEPVGVVTLGCVPDPAAVEGADAQKWLAFRTVFQALEHRIKLFTSLPIATLDEIKAGAATLAPKPSVSPQSADVARAYVKRARSFAVGVNTPPRFALGATVRCRLDGGSGHTRLPGYVRGRAGVIHAHHGGHILPDASAQSEERGEHLYTVSFASKDLWPEAKGSADRVFVDLWESYLEPA